MTMKLVELKVIGAVRTCYPVVGVTAKSIDKRANLLQGEYRRKVVKIDREVLNTPQGQTGPLQRRLEEFGVIKGLVVGVFGEG